MQCIPNMLTGRRPHLLSIVDSNNWMPPHLKVQEIELSLCLSPLSDSAQQPNGWLSWGLFHIFSLEHHSLLYVLALNEFGHSSPLSVFSRFYTFKNKSPELKQRKHVCMFLSVLLNWFQLISIQSTAFHGSANWKQKPNQMTTNRNYGYWRSESGMQMLTVFRNEWDKQYSKLMTLRQYIDIILDGVILYPTLQPYLRTVLAMRKAICPSARWLIPK